MPNGDLTYDAAENGEDPDVLAGRVREEGRVNDPAAK